MYGWHLDYPLVFDSAYWFSSDNLLQLGNLSTLDRFVSKAITYGLHQLVGGRMDLFRMTHLLLHAVTAAALFLLVRRTLALALPAQPSFTIALAVAMLFTLHPVLVYAVGDPGQLELVLATLFAILMLLAYVEGLTRSSQLLFVASAGLYALAVLSKENVVPMPAVAAALTLVVRRPSRDLVRQLVLAYGLFAAIAVVVVVTELGQPRDIPGQPTVEAAAMDPRSESLRARAAITQANLFFSYLKVWLIPHVGWMSIDLQYPIAARLIGAPESAGALAFLIYPAVAGWLLFRPGPASVIGFGLLWPWLLFLPELAGMRLTEAFVLYRSYPWLPGILIALIVAVTPVLRRAGWPLLFIACVGLAGLASERLATFASAHSVWDDAVRKNRPRERQAIGAYRAYLNRGQALLDLGRMDAALHDFGMALALSPGLPYAHWNRGLAYVSLRQYEAALAEFDAGLRSPRNVSARARARAFSNRAALYLMLDRRADALADLAQAAALDPGRAEYRTNFERLQAEISAKRER